MPTTRTANQAAAPNTPLIARNVRQRQIQRHFRRPVFRVIGIFILFALIYILLFRAKRERDVHPPGYVEGQHILRIVAVGDLHGDYKNALAVLKMSDVVDENGNWTGKVDYFVQTGDIVDRGLDTIKIYTWFEQLRQQARNAGGNVFSHLGNHEYMNVLGDWRYVPGAEIATFGSVAKRQAALSTGAIGAAWATNYTAVSRIPLHPSSGRPNSDFIPSSTPSPLSHAALSFMHGGLSPIFAASYGSPYPSRINTIGASLLRKCQRRQPPPSPHPPAPYAGLPPSAAQEESEFYSADGPVWYRGWAERDEELICPAAEALAKQIGVKRLIMGHTPDFNRIVSRCHGKVIIIDTGISVAYGGRLSALSITYSLTPISGSANFTTTQAKKGKGVGKWKEQEVVKAIYPDEEVQMVVEERIVTGDFW